MKDTASQETEEHDPLSKISEPLTNGQVQILTKRIQEVDNQLCICFIRHDYTVREQLICRLSPEGDMDMMFGPSQDDDYSDTPHHDIFVLLWRAEHAPESGPGGSFRIPANKHASLSAKHTWFLMGEFELTGAMRDSAHFEHCEGPVKHRFLKNVPYGLSEEFSLPEDSPELSSLHKLLLQGMPMYEEGPSEGTISIGFYIGDDAAFAFLEEMQPEVGRRVELAKIIEGLGCVLEPSFREKAKAIFEGMRIESRNKILHAYANQELQELARLQSEHKTMFGKEVDLSGLE